MKSRRNFKKFLAMVVAISCLSVLGVMPAMAADDIQMGMRNEEYGDNQISPRSPNVTWTSGQSVDVTLSRRVTSYRYTSAARSTNPATGNILLQFKNLDTGTVLTHSFGVPNLGGSHNCNLVVGRYRISQVGGTNGLKADINISF